MIHAQRTTRSAVVLCSLRVHRTCTVSLLLYGTGMGSRITAVSARIGAGHLVVSAARGSDRIGSHLLVCGAAHCCLASCSLLESQRLRGHPFISGVQCVKGGSALLSPLLSPRVELHSTRCTSAERCRIGGVAECRVVEAAARGGGIGENKLRQVRPTRAAATHAEHKWI